MYREIGYKYLKNLGEDNNGFLEESDKRYVDVGFGRQVQRGKIRESLMHLVNLKKSIYTGIAPSAEEMMELQSIIDMRIMQIKDDDKMQEFDITKI